MLSTHYPKCFFEEGRQRRPLKLGIATNIIADKDFDANPELIAAGVDWYISHISYQISLSVAGSKRIDLDGCEVGTVTEQEAIAAQQRANEIGKKLNERKASISQIGLMHPPTPTPTPRTKAAAIAPEFTALYEVLTAANAAVSGIADPTMRAVVLRPLLDHLIKTFQQVRAELENTL